MNSNRTLPELAIQLREAVDRWCLLEPRQLIVVPVVSAVLRGGSGLVLLRLVLLRLVLLLALVLLHSSVLLDSLLPLVHTPQVVACVGGGEGVHATSRSFQRAPAHGP